MRRRRGKIYSVLPRAWYRPRSVGDGIWWLPRELEQRCDVPPDGPDGEGHDEAAHSPTLREQSDLHVPPCSHRLWAKGSPSPNPSSSQLSRGTIAPSLSHACGASVSNADRMPMMKDHPHILPTNTAQQQRGVPDGEPCRQERNANRPVRGMRILPIDAPASAVDP